MRITCLIMLVYLLIQTVKSLSSPIMNPTNPNYQTGTSNILSAALLSTTITTYSLVYPTPMLTASLNASLGIMGTNFQMQGTQFGWSLQISSYSTTSIFFQAKSTASNNQLNILHICYMVTAYSYLHVTYQKVIFAVGTDTVIDTTATDPGQVSCNPWSCRNSARTFTYDMIANPTVSVFLGGFQVNSFAAAATFFGVGIGSVSAGTTSVQCRFYVYGSAKLSSAQIYIVSYDSTAFTSTGSRSGFVGTMNVGCYYTPFPACMPWMMWVPPANINVSLSTVNTNFNTYYSDNYMLGFQLMIVDYDSTPSKSFSFDIISTSNSGTAYQSIFSYTGSASGFFYGRYSYMIIFQFYCNSVGTDIYYVYGQNMCDSNCNNSIGQYPDVNNYCQLCSVYCFKCAGSANLCTQCVAAQNRIKNGNICMCDPNGYYDDLSSLVCPKCYYTCLTCSGPSAGQCITCPLPLITFRVMSINTCLCIDRYYDSGAQICANCHHSCLTCSSSTSTTCQTCSATDFRTITLLNSCPCNTGYYQVASNSVCGLCHYTCLTCSGASSSSCTTCDNTIQFRVVTPSGGKCPCLDGYYDNGLAICQPCFVNCATCNGPMNTDCLTCSSALFRGLQGTMCLCKAQYYQLSLVCYSCHYSCYNCTSGTKFSCINCNNGVTFRLFNGTNSQCYCKDGYVDVGVAVCALCDRTCLTCQNATTVCLTCNPLLFRQLTGASCPCLFGYIDSGLASGMCYKCHYSCITCSGTGTTQCILCNTAIRYLTAINQCLCNPGTYDNGISSSCFPCDSTCQQCSDQYPTTCTQCNTATYLRQLLVSPGPCTCIQRYFVNAGALLCDACYVTCLTCSVIATNCTSCDLATNFRYLAPGSNCLCIGHYYQVYGQSCVSCISTCGNCSIQPNNCTSCNPDRYLSSTNCLCNLGTYEDAFLVCQPCQYTCLTCVTLASTCLTCPNFSYRTFGSSSCPCNFGYYDNNVALCVKCPYQCFGCTGPNPPLCVACPALSFRTLQPNKACPCDVGYYDDGSSPLCKACKPTCASCSAYSVCTSCYPLALQLRTLSASTCKCQPGYYDNLINTICQPCHYSCLTCTSSLSTSCILCNPFRSYQLGSCPCQNGFYQAAQICYPCDLTCATCLGTAISCTGCDMTIRYLFNGQCLCREGFFDNGGNCATCDISCQTCFASATNCLSCNVAFFTYLNVNTCVCPSTQYQNITSLICTNCHANCVTCSSAGPNACLSCLAANYRTFNGLTFKCDCMPNYYDNGPAHCANCDPTCFNCYGPSAYNCTQCYPGAIKIGSSCRSSLACVTGYYYSGTCVTTCPNTTYPNINTCTTCTSYCKTCTSPVYCLSCVSSYFLNVLTHTCIPNCPISTYMSIPTLMCVNCPTGCLTCSQVNNSVECTECLIGWYLFRWNTCVDATFCSTPNYVVRGNQCIGCLLPCNTCVTLAFDGCLTCSSGFSLYLGQCLSICPLGFFSLSQVCQPCESTCLKCQSTSCQLCIDGYYLTPDLINPKCIPNGYFYDPLLNQNVKCHPNCFSCTNSSFSSCITCNSFRGDTSEMAISGYCDCWVDSMDLGNGSCSFDEYDQLLTYTQVLKSSSDSVLYFSSIASITSGNIISAGLFVMYQQSYSTLYFINSSSVLQTSSLLKKSLSSNPNFFLNKQPSKSPLITYSRLLVSTQSSISLFTRSSSTPLYLIDWAFYSILIIAFGWVFVFLTGLLLKYTCLRERSGLSVVMVGVRNVISEPLMVVLLFLTVSEVALYATAWGLYVFSMLDQIEVDWIKMILSCAVALYYPAYLIRLFIGCRKPKIQQVKSIPNRNSLKILTAFFAINSAVSSNKEQTSPQHPYSKKCYLPLLMLRMMASSVLMITLASNPTNQCLSLLIVFIVWTFYSLFNCPYPKFYRLFIHLNQILYLSQLSMFMYMVVESQASRILPAHILLVLDGVQIAVIAVFGILLVVKVIWQICQENRSKTNNQVGNVHTKDEMNHQSEVDLTQTKDQFDEDGENIFGKDLNHSDMNTDDYYLRNQNKKLSNPVQSIQKLPEFQGQDFVIRKKYRAVRKNKL